MPKQLIETPNGGLTPEMDAWVDAYVSNGGNARAATEAAGYGGQRIDHHARRLLAHPVVTAEIQRRTAQALAHLAPKAVATLQRLVDGARSEYVQLQSAIDLLDRLGFKAPDRHEHQVSGDLKVVIDLSEGEDSRVVSIEAAHPPGGGS